MTNKDIFHAMDGLDARFVISAAPGQKAPKPRNTWMRWAALAACFCMIVTVTLMIALGNPFAPTPIDPSVGNAPSDSGDGGIQKPDKIYTFDGNEKMTCSCGKCYAVFDHLYLTDAINGTEASEGGYLIFAATVSTDHHWIVADSVTLDYDLFHGGVYAFHEALSEQFSDTENTFDRNTTVLNGRISFVFALDESAYTELCVAVENALSEDTITLSPDMAWRGGRCLFAFTVNDIEKVANYN